MLKNLLSLAAAASILPSVFAMNLEPAVQANAGLSTPPPTPMPYCYYVHSWQNYTAKAGSWNMTLTRTYGPSYFFNAFCEQVLMQPTTDYPMYVAQGTAFDLGLGYGVGESSNLSYVVTAVNTQALTGVLGENKKCVFVVDAHIPTAPVATVQNFNGAACEFTPGSPSHYVFK